MGSYYYQIGGDINNADKRAKLDKWQTTDLGQLSKNTCMNVNTAVFKKGGSKAMSKDDNEAMFVPKGYAILGYDHDNCEETGRGAQFYHGYHTSGAANNAAKSAVKAISGNKPGGVYNYYGPNGGRDEDQPRDLAKKMSSWKVYDLNSRVDFENVMVALDSIDSSGAISANKRAYKRTLCQNVDKNYFDTAYTADAETRRVYYREACDLILNSSELDRAWPESTPALVPTTVPAVVPVAGPSEESDDYDDDYDDDYEDEDDADPPVDPPADPPETDETDETDWLLYGGISTGVCSCIVVVIIIILLMMKKKK
jgi:hypothetical protein